MNKFMNKFLMIFCALTLIIGVAQAAPIPGLFNTGQNVIGSIDQNYTLGGGDAYALLSIDPDWYDPLQDPNYGTYAFSWIGINGGGYSAPVASYSYSLMFDMTGLDPTTASISGDWAVDNVGIMLLNGMYTGNSLSGLLDTNFENLHSFNITSGFVSGTNILTFVVTNLPPAVINPSGLLVENLEGKASPVPIPAAIWLLGSGLIGIAGLRYRGRRE